MLLLRNGRITASCSARPAWKGLFHLEVVVLDLQSGSKVRGKDPEAGFLFQLF